LTIVVSQTSNSQTFGTIQTRVNQLAYLVSTNVVTADATSGGSLTTGNVSVNGFITANTLSANVIQGGIANTPANLNISTNTLFNYGLNNIAAITSNSTNSQITINSNNLSVLNTTIVTGNATFANNITFNNSVNVISNVNTNNIIANTATFGIVVANTSTIKIGSNVSANATQLTIGNTTANTTTLNVANILANGVSVNTFTSTTVTVGNVVANTIQLTIGNTTANTTTLNVANVLANGISVNTLSVSVSVPVGANVLLNTSSLNIGNSTVNSVLTSTTLGVNAITANIATIGSAVINTSAFSIGSNVQLNANTLIIGNSTINAVINSTFLNIANVTVSSNLIVSGTLVVNGVAFTGTVNTTLILFPTADNSNAVGNSTYRFANMWSVNSYTNTASVTGTLSIGSNVVINTSSLQLGNSTVNSVHTSTALGVNAITSNTLNVNTTVINSSMITLNGLANLTTTSLQFNGGYNTVVNTTGLYMGTYTTVNESGANFDAPYLRFGLLSQGFAQGKWQANNYAVFLRNDDNNFYILQTNSGYGGGDSWNTLRPFTMNLNSGHLTLDANGAGITMGNIFSTNTSLVISSGNTSIYANTITGNGIVSISNGGYAIVGLANNGVGTYAGYFGGNFGAGGLYATASNNGTGITSSSLSGSAISASSNSGVGVSAGSNTNYGVFGSSNSSVGVYGTSNFGWGVEGTSNSNYGVYGISNTSYGVIGQSNTGDGVSGSANSGFGVYGTSASNWSGYFSAATTSGSGVYGFSFTSTGSQGVSYSGYGVYGQSNTNTGTTGLSNTGYGVYGFSNSNYGVFGNSNTSPGVVGTSNTSYGGYFVSYNTQAGVYGSSNTNSGVYGISNSGYGVQGISNNYIGVFGQGNAQPGGWFVSNSGYGVQGVSNTSTGVYGSSNSSYGGYFISNTFTGLQGVSNSGTGVYGQSNTSPGVVGISNSGFGGFFVSNNLGLQVNSTSTTGGLLAQFSNNTGTQLWIDNGGALHTNSYINASANIVTSGVFVGNGAGITGIGSSLAVRQTVVNGDNTNGLPSFMTTGSGLIPAYTTGVPLILYFANGFNSSGYNDSLTSLSSPGSLATCSANVTNFIYATYSSSTSVTWGSTIAPPQYGQYYNQAAQYSLTLNNSNLDDFGSTWINNSVTFSSSSPKIASTYYGVFNGTTSYMKNTSILTLNGPNNGAFTIRAWAYGTAFASVTTLFGGSFNASYGFVVGVNSSGKTLLYLSSAGSSWDIASATTGTVTITTNTWHFYELTYDPVAGKYYYYVDGVLDQTITSTSKNVGTGGLQIGAFGTIDLWTGYIQGVEYMPYCLHPAGTTYSVPTALGSFNTGVPINDWFDTLNYVMKTPSAASGSAGSNPTFTAYKKLYVGEATSGASSISSVTPYAFNRMNTSTLQAIPSTTLNINHNLGISPTAYDVAWHFVCVSPLGGYNVGDEIPVYGGYGTNGQSLTESKSGRNAAQIACVSSSVLYVVVKAGGTAFNLASYLTYFNLRAYTKGRF